eukprot:8450177-Alexandrium_andersonii.AAC.1
MPTIVVAGVAPVVGICPARAAAAGSLSASLLTFAPAASATLAAPAVADEHVGRVSDEAGYG